jgi:GNAT superfamily N-acetyltransferase
MDSVAYEFNWRGDFANTSLNALHAEAFDHRLLDIDWNRQVREHSLGWVCAHQGSELVGFVNVPWDGAVHAFLVDTVVAERALRQGVGRQLVARAVAGARAAGCEWVHVDFRDHLRPCYFDACGFRPTPAGVICLAAPTAHRQDC